MLAQAGFEKGLFRTKTSIVTSLLIHEALVFLYTCLAFLLPARSYCMVGMLCCRGTTTMSASFLRRIA